MAVKLDFSVPKQMMRMSYGGKMVDKWGTEEHNTKSSLLPTLLSNLKVQYVLFIGI